MLKWGLFEANFENSLQNDRTVSGIVVMPFSLAPYRDGEREVSVVKVVHSIQHHIRQVMERLGNLEQLTATLHALTMRLLKNGMKDKRHKRLTTAQSRQVLETT